MGISRYVSKEALNTFIYNTIKDLVLPAIKSVVDESSNVYDDAGYAVIEGLVNKVLEKFRPEGEAKPESFKLVRK